MNHAQLDVYKDVPLSTSQSQIRILRLEPCTRERDAHVECALTVADLEHAPTFEALSYAWGERHNLKIINLNGHAFGVTKNLESALRHLRRKDHPRMLWVDALCINQLDLVERSFQVAMMHKIYQTAQRTVSWLGEDDKHGESALMFLQWYAKRKVDVHPADVDAYDAEYEARGWRAATELMRRPYWRRLWVMQEIAFSQTQPRICCGTKRIQWGTLILALEDTELAYYSQRLHRVRGATKELVRQGSKERPSRNGRHVIFLLSHSTGFETSEPRDRVYALYGLCKVAGIVDFEPDYTKSVTEVYQQVTEFGLHMKNSLNILELRSHLQGEDMPSWVIDLSKPSPASFPKLKNVEKTTWQRLDDHEQPVNLQMSIDPEYLVLEVAGAVLDQVYEVHPVPPCVATALRNAGEDPAGEQHSVASLRSSNHNAMEYWDQLQTKDHTTALCHNLIKYISAFKEVVATFCYSRSVSELPDWYPRPWNIDQIGDDVIDCTAKQKDLRQNKEIPASPYRQSMQWMLCTLSLMLYGRSCFTTRRGLTGAALVGVKPGDKVVAFQSTKQLHLLRDIGNGRYQYAGVAILTAPGTNDGLAAQTLATLLAEVREGVNEDQNFQIV